MKTRPPRLTTIRSLSALAAMLLAAAVLTPMTTAAADDTVYSSLAVSATATHDPATLQSSRGTVTSGPAGISCSVIGTSAPTGACKAFFAQHSTVTLTATPQDSVICLSGTCSSMFGMPSVFVGWGGACAYAGSNPTCTVVMSQLNSVSAAFDLARVDVDVTVTGERQNTLLRASKVATGTVVAYDNTYPPREILRCSFIADNGVFSAHQVGTCHARVPVGSGAPFGVRYEAIPGPVMSCTSLTCSTTSTTSSFQGWGGPCAYAGRQTTCTLQQLGDAHGVTAAFGFPRQLS